MTGTAGAGEAQRLDELAAVTREYARYSRTRFGLAVTFSGGWLALAGAAIAASSSSGPYLLRLTPLVWLLALPRARGFYQRRGAVSEGEAVPFPLASAGEGRVVFLGLTWIWCVLGIVVAGESGRGALLFGATVFVAVAGMAAQRAEGAADATMTSVLTLIGAASALGSWGPIGRGAFHLALGGALAAGGAWQHWKYRALERRLAALRSPAA